MKLDAKTVTEDNSQSGLMLRKNQTLVPNLHLSQLRMSERAERMSSKVSTRMSNLKDTGTDRSELSTERRKLKKKDIDRIKNIASKVSCSSRL